MGAMSSDQLVARRVIARSGGRARAHAHLGGSLATAGDLAAVVGPMVDIASQHDQQSLTDPESQLAILDAFAANAALRAEMATAHAAAREAEVALATFAADARARAEREDLLRFQLAELETASPVAGEDEALAGERERLRGQNGFMQPPSSGEEVLYAGDGAVSERIAGVLRDLQPLAALDPGLAPDVERLREVAATIEDVARSLGRYAHGVRSDPARLAEIDERLHLLQRLCRKHGGTVADLAARRAALVGGARVARIVRRRAGSPASGGRRRRGAGASGSGNARRLPARGGPHPRAQSRKRAARAGVRAGPAAAGARGP